MWIIMDEQLAREKEQFALKECCEECVHFCSSRKQCGMLYPVDAHRRETFEQAQMGDRIYFCKMFEVT